MHTITSDIFNNIKITLQSISPIPTAKNKASTNVHKRKDYNSTVREK